MIGFRFTGCFAEASFYLNEAPVNCKPNTVNRMNALKKYAGILWILLGLYVGYDRVLDSLTKIGSEKLEDRVFGWVVLLVLVPIIVGGLITFGRYALAGEYDA
jgi:hypothetical protein